MGRFGRKGKGLKEVWWDEAFSGRMGSDWGRDGRMSWDKGKRWYGEKRWDKGNGWEESKR